MHSADEPFDLLASQDGLDFCDDEPDEAEFVACEQRLGYFFHRKALLRCALTHASGADHRLVSNERLEFLGDALLGAIVCEELFRAYPHFAEGDLTQVKSIVVSRQSCTRVARTLGLDHFLIVGKGIQSQAEVPDSLLANAFESVVAAIYLDGGAQVTRRFVLQHMRPEMARIADGDVVNNFKSQLQQLAQRDFNTTPSYHLLDEKGPAHSRCFKISAFVGAKRFQAAWGRTKKEAEQRAAHNALCQLEGESPIYPSDD